MKILKRVLWQFSALVLLVFGALFAWANPHVVTVNLPLMDTPLSVPVWALVLASVFVGFFAAMIISQGEMLGLKLKMYQQGRKQG